MINKNFDKIFNFIVIIQILKELSQNNFIMDISHYNNQINMPQTTK